jgi:lysylphosphatidylglycerol synthetase-like protein (DUF2156 family)
MGIRTIGGLEAKTMSQPEKWDLLSPYLKQHGSHCMAYSTLQPDMEYFLIDDVGYVAYMTHAPFGIKSLKRKFVLSDPICAKENMPEIVKEFLRENCRSCFVQVHKDVANLLYKEHGMYGTQMGVETEVDLKEWDLKGKSKSTIRRWINTAKNAGVTIERVSSLQDIHGRQNLLEEWRKKKATKNALKFLQRGLYLPGFPEDSTEIYLARSFSKEIGFVEFDPMYSKGKVDGHYANIIVFSEDAPNGTSDLIINFAMEKMKNDELENFSLGLSPLANHQKFLGDPLLGGRLLNFLYNRGNRLYNFKGIYFHKQKYCPKEIPVFISGRGRTLLGEITETLRVCGVI